MTEEIRERYHNDNTFRAIVDAQVSYLVNGYITTADIGRAATLAAQLYAEKYRAPQTLFLIEQKKG